MGPRHMTVSIKLFYKNCLINLNFAVNSKVLMLRVHQSALLVESRQSSDIHAIHAPQEKETLNHYQLSTQELKKQNIYQCFNILTNLYKNSDSLTDHMLKLASVIHYIYRKKFEPLLFTCITEKHLKQALESLFMSKLKKIFIEVCSH